MFLQASLGQRAAALEVNHSRAGAAGALGARSSGCIRLWVVIFTVVALQMGTSLRLLIGTVET